MWWCRSFRKISPMPDGHVRPVIGCWAKEDVRGRPLEISSLSGKLTATQGFRGTVCSVGEFEYLLNRINGELPEAVRAAEEARDALRDRIEALISGLHWRDFEILVDLIFRGAGLQRVSELGKTLKEIDLDLLAPLTNERYAAQVKSRAGLRELQHLEDAFTDLHGFSRVYLVVHTPQAGLRDAAPAEPLEVLGPRQLADLSLRYGLTEWIIARAS